MDEKNQNDGGLVQPGTIEWHALVTEEIIEPGRPINDPHHHLWESPHPKWGTYTLEDLWSDTESGHNIEKTVFIDCHSSYLEDGPEHLKPIGETRFAASAAEESAKQKGRATICAIVSRADLLLGEAAEEVVLAHEEAGRGLFRGIRHAGAYDATGSLYNPGSRQPCPYSAREFRVGVRMLGRLGYTFDAWHFFHQNREFLSLARAVPDTVMILDHFGTPLGAGAYAGKQDEIFYKWKKDIQALAECPNVYAKLGGLAMPDNGFGWDRRHRPPTSDEFVAAQRKYYLHTITCFGPGRCMFESNFPVDKRSISYHVLWNGMKKMVADFTEPEKYAMFHGTAARVYRL